MALRYDPTERYDAWLSRIQEHELKLARQKLAKGEPVDQVMEDLSKNLAKKFLHPIFAMLHQRYDNFDTDQSRTQYYEIMNVVGPKADQVNSDT
jgi:glutamyl-tRNA reductase